MARNPALLSAVAANSIAGHSDSNQSNTSTKYYKPSWLQPVVLGAAWLQEIATQIFAAESSATRCAAVAGSGAGPGGPT